MNTSHFKSSCARVQTINQSLLCKRNRMFIIGLTENAGPENEGPKNKKNVSTGPENKGPIMQGWKMQERKIRDQIKY